MNQQPNNKPDLVLRDGSLKATIWRNEGEKGPYWTTTFAKTINGQNNQPRDIQSFSQTDILRLNELGREAYGMINDLRQEYSQQQRQQHTHVNSQQQSNHQGSNTHNQAPQQVEQQQVQEREAFREQRRQPQAQTPQQTYQR